MFPDFLALIHLKTYMRQSFAGFSGADGWETNTLSPLVGERPCRTVLDSSNGILRCLSKADLDALQPDLHPVDLPARMQLERPNKPIKQAYFLESGFASVVANGTGESIEVGMIGREG